MSEQNNYVQIKYNNQDILVSKKVAEFLEQDRKRIAALQRSDRRHIIFEDPTKALGIVVKNGSPVLYQVIRTLDLENLRKAFAELDITEKQILRYRYYDEMTLKQIGCKFGVSKVAIYKRLKRLEEKLKRSIEYRAFSFINFYYIIVFKLTNSLRVSYIMRGLFFLA